MDGGQKETDITGKDELDVARNTPKDGNSSENERMREGVLIVAGSHVGQSDTDAKDILSNPSVSQLEGLRSNRVTPFEDEIPSTSRAFFEQRQIEMSFLKEPDSTSDEIDESEDTIDSDDPYNSERFVYYRRPQDRVKIDESMFEKSQLGDVLDELNKSVRHLESSTDVDTLNRIPANKNLSSNISGVPQRFNTLNKDVLKKDSLSTSSQNPRMNRSIGKKDRSRTHRSRYEEFYSQKSKRIPKIKDKTPKTNCRRPRMALSTMTETSTDTSSNFKDPKLIKEPRWKESIQAGVDQNSVFSKPKINSEDYPKQPNIWDISTQNEYGENTPLVGDAEHVDIPENVEGSPSREERKKNSITLEQFPSHADLVFEDSDADDIGFASSEGKITVILDALSSNQSQQALSVPKTSSTFELVKRIVSEMVVNVTGINTQFSSESLHLLAEQKKMSECALRSIESGEQIMKQEIINPIGDSLVENRESEQFVDKPKETLMECSTASPDEQKEILRAIMDDGEIKLTSIEPNNINTPENSNLPVYLLQEPSQNNPVANTNLEEKKLDERNGKSSLDFAMLKLAKEDSYVLNVDKKPRPDKELGAVGEDEPWKPHGPLDNAMAVYNTVDCDMKKRANCENDFVSNHEVVMDIMEPPFLAKHRIGSPLSKSKDHTVINIDMAEVETPNSERHSNIPTNVTFVDEKKSCSSDELTIKQDKEKESKYTTGTIVDGCCVRTCFIDENVKSVPKEGVSGTLVAPIVPNYPKQPIKPSPIPQPSPLPEERKKPPIPREPNHFTVTEENIPNVTLRSLSENQNIQVEAIRTPAGSRTQPRPNLLTRLWNIFTNFFTAIIICLHVNRDCIFCLGFFIAFVVSASFLTAFFYRTLNINPHLYQRPSTGHITVAGGHASVAQGDIPRDNNYIF